MRLSHNGLAIIALILSGCASEQSPRPDLPQSESGGSSSAQSPSEGLPVVAPMLGTGKLMPPDNPDKFTFVVFGDNRPGKNDTGQPPTIKEIFTEINGLKPAFAMSLGDVIAGKPKKDDPNAIATIRKQFDEFLALAATAGAPIYNAPGNHEMDDHDDIPTERMHELYQDCVGPSYGAFTYGNSRFIALNTEDVPGPDVPKPPADEEFSYMNDKQIAELKADLDANRDKKHIFITMHYPIHAKDQGPPDTQWDDRLYPESRDVLVEMFKDYDNIAYVLAAHEHLYFNPQEPENVTDVPGWKTGQPIVYLVSGGAGAPLNKGKWGFHHYLVFNGDGDNVSVELVKLDSTGASS